MTVRPPNRIVAATFTIAPAIAGVMLFNLATWMLSIAPQYGGLGSDDRFVVNVVFLGMSVGILGACVGTYRFIRTGHAKQPGLWLLFAVGCISGKLPNATLNVLPLSVGFQLRLDTSTIGVNFLGAILLLAYSGVLLSQSPHGGRGVGN